MPAKIKADLSAEARRAKAEPKDVFMHFLAIITLYSSVTAFLILVFQYINVSIPDLLTKDYYQWQSYFNGIRMSIASLIVIFPVFAWANYFLNKIYKGEPSKRDLRIRKWLLNLTVFAAALIVIGDLVALIFNFLNGDLTTKFILKITAVFFVAASVFFYYFWELKSWSKIPALVRKIFIYAIIAVVAITIIAGFLLVGSPNKARLTKFDEQRVSDLQVIQSQIIYYWQNKEKLPAKLDDLKDTISGFNPGKDPETGENYNYYAKGELEFSLCANFNLPSSEGIPSGSDSNWTHAAGYICFDRTIDKDLYKPVKK